MKHDLDKLFELRDMNSDPGQPVSKLNSAEAAIIQFTEYYFLYLSRCEPASSPEASILAIEFWV